jgi:hypothetical protein
VLGLDLEPFQQRIASVFSERREALILLHPRWRQRTATYASRESGDAAIRWEADPIHPPPMLSPAGSGPPAEEPSQVSTGLRRLGPC